MDREKGTRDRDYSDGRPVPLGTGKAENFKQPNGVWKRIIVWSSHFLVIALLILIMPLREKLKLTEERVRELSQQLNAEGDLEALLIKLQQKQTEERALSVAIKTLQESHRRLEAKTAELNADNEGLERRKRELTEAMDQAETKVRSALEALVAVELSLELARLYKKEGKKEISFGALNKYLLPKIGIQLVKGSSLIEKITESPESKFRYDNGGFSLK